MIWIPLPRSTRPKSWDSTEGPVVPLECNLHGHLLAVLLWKRTIENILLDEDWEQSIWMGVLTSSPQIMGYFLQYTWTILTWLTSKRTYQTCVRDCGKSLTWKLRHRFSTRYTSGALDVKLKSTTELLWRRQKFVDEAYHPKDGCSH